MAGVSVGCGRIGRRMTSSLAPLMSAIAGLPGLADIPRHRSASDQVDVVVLGLGPGGEYLASALAREGLDVVAVDERDAPTPLRSRETTI